MKLLSNKIIIAFLAVVVASGCTKKFEELNTDPNSVTINNYNPLYHLTPNIFFITEYGV